MVWEAAPIAVVLWAVVLLVQAMLPVALVYLTRSLVDGLMRLVGGSLNDPLVVVIPAVLLGAVMLATELLRGLSSYISTVQGGLLQDRVLSRIHRQAVDLELAFYERPDFYDHLHRARAEAGHRPLALMKSLGGLVQHGLTLVAMCAVLVSLGPIVPLILVASTLPAFYVVMRYGRRQYAWRREVTEKERRASYFSFLLTARESAPEVRLFGLGGSFQAAFDTTRTWLRRGECRLARQHLIAELAGGLVALGMTGGVMAWMVWRAWQGEVTLGELAMFYQAFQQGQKMMRSMLTQVGQLYQNSLFVGNLFEYLDLEPVIVSPPDPIPFPCPIRDGFRLDNVSFEYPGSTRPALQSLDLQIPTGRIVAIVGANGAGKTTLTKLLCRFYDPTGGCVTLDGVDLREFSLEQLRRSITVLFQSPMRYSATVSENIAWSAPYAEPGPDEIRRAAQAAGVNATIERLPAGYDQLLGKWFQDGAELSVGQWQRIALARAFLRQAGLIILDEPTSAMDPWAEAEWLQRFRSLVIDRAALIITHRFTTAMHADVIHVMERGAIVESGNHGELLDQDCRYAQAWQAQMLAARSCASHAGVV